MTREGTPMNLDAILTERLAIVGGTGSGKSYTARGLAERVLTAGSRLGVIDPTGVWHGLRVRADGSPGFPVVIFGGDRSDVPLLETAGRVIAQAVAATRQSWVIDTSALRTKAAERRFMLDFLDAIFMANRADITLIVDEADRFSPQRMSPEVARLHERMEEIVRRGRVRGFTPWLITQRPASLNKDVLSQATAMICMRMTGAHDRQAIADVIEGQADKAIARQIIGAMPNHKVGHGLVWAPQQDFLEPVHFPRIQTADTMRAPKPGERLNDKPLPPIDLGKLKEQLATVEEEAKANDPAVLKKRIRELEAEIARKPTQGVDAATLDRAQKEAHADGVKQGIESGYRAGWNDCVQAGKRALEALPVPIAAPPQLGQVPAPQAGVAHRRAPYVPAPPPQRQASARATGDGDKTLPRGEKACLICAAQQADGATREQLTVVTGYKRSSRDAYIQRLREKGYVETRGDQIVATNQGIAALGGDYEPLPVGEALRAFHLERLPEGERRVLTVVLDAYPGAVARDAIDKITEYKRSSRDAYLQRLSARRLITAARGEVRASDHLFAE